jgi:hypothetical protein
MGREADLTGEDVGSVFKQLDDPPPGEEKSKNTPEDISCDISGRSLNGRETSDLGRKQPNQRPVCLRPKPNLVIRPRNFLAATAQNDLERERERVERKKVERG